MKHIFKLVLVVFALSISITSCESLEVENTNQPNREKALASANDLSQLIQAAGSNVLKHIIGFQGIYMNLMSDQTSTTNAYLGFWNFADQPRLQINNSPTNADLGAQLGSWGSLNNYIYSANTVIGIIEFDGIPQIIDGVDVSNELLTRAYFVKGLAQGYLSMIFDQGYVVNPDTDLAALALVPHTELRDAAIANLETSISLMDSSFEYFVHAAYAMDSDEFRKVANSFMAKILISSPRTAAEANSVDYSKVLQYANAGITQDFDPLTDGGYQFFNNMQDWCTYTLSDGAGYLPTDVKVMRFLDSNVPADYPTDATVILEDVTSDDPRAEYFGYASAFGFLRESRGRELFTNWKNNRFFTANDRGTLPGLSTDIFHTEELDYIKAEATWRSSGAAAGAAVMNSSARFTKGGITTNGTDADMEHALHYEYSVELDLAASIGTQWFFMRRHDMLQTGTPLHYPVPGTELEITGTPIYSFGGESNGGSEGTADGSNNWKN